MTDLEYHVIENNTTLLDVLTTEFRDLPALISKYPGCCNLKKFVEYLLRSGSEDISIEDVTGENTKFLQFASMTLVDDDTSGFLLSPTRLLHNHGHMYIQRKNNTSTIFGILQSKSSPFHDNQNEVYLLAADDTVFAGDLKNILYGNESNNTWISKLLRL